MNGSDDNDVDDVDEGGIIINDNDDNDEDDNNETTMTLTPIRRSEILQAVEQVDPGIDMVDAVTLMTILARSGLVTCADDLSKAFEKATQRRRTSEKDDVTSTTDANEEEENDDVDEHERLQDLLLEPNDDESPSWDLPDTIGRMGAVSLLTLERCRSIPLELSNILSLKALELDSCHDFQECPPSLILSKVKTLEIGGEIGGRVEAVRNMIRIATKIAPILDSLDFSILASQEMGIVVDCLKEVVDDLPDSLLSLHFYSCDMDSKHFETLMCDIVPRISSLKTVWISGAAVESLKGVEKRLQETPSLSSRVRQLHLHAPVMERLSADCAEKEALIALLDRYNELQVFGFQNDQDDNKNSFDHSQNHNVYNDIFDSEIASRLMKNVAGRCLVDSVETGKGKVPAISLSLWPMVLERALNTCLAVKCDTPNCEHHKRHCCTGPYYLLRHGPVGKNLFEGNFPLESSVTIIESKK